MTGLRRTFGAALAAAAVALGGCDDVTVVVLEPSRVEIAPAPVTLDFTESTTLTARVLDDEGRALEGYSVQLGRRQPVGGHAVGRRRGAGDE